MFRSTRLALSLRGIMRTSRCLTTGRSKADACAHDSNVVYTPCFTWFEVYSLRIIAALSGNDTRIFHERFYERIRDKKVKNFPCG